MLYNSIIRLFKIIYILLSILYIINYFSNKIVESFSNNSIIPIYVISLEKSTDRREYINNLLKDVQFLYLNGIDGSDIKEEDLYLKDKYVDIHYTYSKGELGCLLSHIKLLKQISESENDISLIFEDDIIFKNNLNIIDTLHIIKNIKNIHEYDIIYLGHCFEDVHTNETIDEITYNNNIYRIAESVKPFCTHAYIITKNGAQKIMNFLNNNDYKIVDTIDALYITLIQNKIITSLSFKDTLISQAYDVDDSLNFGSYTQPNRPKNGG
jgi:glycosyl transferase family 25